MKIVLADINKAVCDEWVKRTEWDVHHGNILELEADAVASPGNSFGFMDGGVDLVFMSAFGSHVQKAVQDLIKSEGELLVGQAVSVKTRNAKIPWLIYAPTMRVPMVIPDPVSVYLAARAATRRAMALEAKTLVVPGFGTATGRVKVDWAVSMMRAGIEDALDPPEFPASTQEAMEQHVKAYVRE